MIHKIPVKVVERLANEAELVSKDEELPIFAKNHYEARAITLRDALTLDAENCRRMSTAETIQELNTQADNRGFRFVCWCIFSGSVVLGLYIAALATGSISLPW